MNNQLLQTFLKFCCISFLEDPAPICPQRRDLLGVRTCQVLVVVPPRAMVLGQDWGKGWAGVQGGGALISGRLVLCLVISDLLSLQSLWKYQESREG